jgi:hypothetical protein
MKQEIDFLVLGLDNEIDNLLYLSNFGMVDILPEVKCLTPLLYLQLAPYRISCIIEFNLEIVHKKLVGFN